MGCNKRSEGSVALAAYYVCAQVRNERALEALREELEELDEQMTDCITDSIKGRQVGQGSTTWDKCHVTSVM